MNTQKIVADLQSIAFYDGSKHIYAQVKLRETLRKDFRTLDDCDRKISILIISNDENRLQTAKIITAVKRTVKVAVDLDTRTEIQDRFGKIIGRYLATTLEQHEDFRL